MPPSAAPLVTPADLLAWFVLAPLAVLGLATARELQAGHILEAQRLADTALVVCVAGALSIVAWSIWGAP